MSGKSPYGRYGSGQETWWSVEGSLWLRDAWIITTAHHLRSPRVGRAISTRPSDLNSFHKRDSQQGLRDHITHKKSSKDIKRKSSPPSPLGPRSANARSFSQAPTEYPACMRERCQPSFQHLTFAHLRRLLFFVQHRTFHRPSIFQRASEDCSLFHLPAFALRLDFGQKLSLPELWGIIAFPSSSASGFPCGFHFETRHNR